MGDRIRIDVGSHGVTMESMLIDWIRARPEQAPFVVSDEGTLTFGELAGVDPASGMRVVTPGRTLDSLKQLVVGADSSVALVDPGLDPAESRRRRALAQQVGPAEALTLVFTSGTTGPAKAVRLTIDNWSAAVTSSAAHLGHESDDVWLACMPIHHVGGLSILFRCAWVGGSVRWLPRFTPGAAADLLGEVTVASLVPTMLRRILDLDDRRYAGLKAVLVGGGPIPSGLLEAAHDRGIPALPTYGMTETCAQAATLLPGSKPRNAADPLPGVEFSISAGGAIRVRGRQVSPGYVGGPDREPNDWLVTADQGRIEPDGAIVVTGRSDDVIITGGENVDPAKVEAAIERHRRVAEAIVAGVPDPEWGSRVVAAYVGEAGPSEVLAWLESRLAAFEIPKSLIRIEAVPTTRGGKKDRRALAEWF